jgi:transposase
MERSAIHLMAKRGKSIRQIAQEVGRSPTTISRVLREPLDREPATRQRGSQVDPYRAQIAAWLEEDLPVVRMLELARGDPEQPYTGGRSQFGEMVRRMKRARTQHDAQAAVPIRFEGLPGEYLQVDWGEIRRFPFPGSPLGAPPAARYFLACRLKYSRWSWVRWTRDMRQETLLRGLVGCLVALGWVPWVLLFDNMKTVTSGRDASHAPIWHPALLHLAGEFGFHPEACDPGAGNQKGSVESLVKWVKGNFLPGRSFVDDVDLAEQTTRWLEDGNARPSAATGEPPAARLATEAQRGGSLPASASDYGLLASGRVSAEALVAVHGNRYSVPTAHVGAPVTIRVHQQRIRVWRDLACLADHPRAPDGAHQRIVDPEHFVALFAAKPRGQIMLYRDALVALGGHAPAFISELSRRHRASLPEEIRTLYALYQEHGRDRLLAAMALADAMRCYRAATLIPLLGAPLPDASSLALAGVPQQEEIDRDLALYEACVVLPVARGEADR